MLRRLETLLNLYLRDTDEISLDLEEDKLRFCYKDGHIIEINRTDIPVTEFCLPNLATAKDVLHDVEELHQKAQKIIRLFLEGKADWQKKIMIKTCDDFDFTQNIIRRSETDYISSFMSICLEDGDDTLCCPLSVGLYQFLEKRHTTEALSEMWKLAEKNTRNLACVQIEQLSGFPVSRKYFTIAEQGAWDYSQASYFTKEDSLLIRVFGADATYIALQKEFTDFFTSIYADGFKIVRLGGDVICICNRNRTISEKDISLWNTFFNEFSSIYIDKLLVYSDGGFHHETPEDERG